MKVAMFIGNHAGDTLLVRAGCWLTRRVQKGPYATTTHVEAIHAEHADGSVTIASSSIRDGGVRDKRVWLNPLHWRVIDVPYWDVRRSIEHLSRTRGEKYDKRGAIATVFIGSQDPGQWFCNEHVGYPFLKAAATFSPSTFHAVCLSFGKDITDEFFKVRQYAARHT